MIRLLLTSAFFLSAVPLASAQATFDRGQSAPVSSTEVEAIRTASDIATDLRTGSAVTRATALREAHELASAASPQEAKRPLLSALLYVVENDNEAAHRVMASQALCAVGDRGALRSMRRIASSEPDPWVRQTVLRAAEACSARTGR